MDQQTRTVRTATQNTPTARRQAERIFRMSGLDRLIAARVLRKPVRALASSPRPQVAAASNAMRTAMASGWDGGVAELVIDPRDAAPLPGLPCHASPFPASLSTPRRDSAECPVAVLGQGDQERAIVPSQLLPNATSPQAHGRAAG